MKTGNIRRNQPCPCGSGKKAKKCCLPRIKQLASLPPEVRTQAIIAGILGHWPTAEPTPRPPVASTDTPALADSALMEVVRANPNRTA